MDLIIALNSFLRRVERTAVESIGGLFQAYVYADEQIKLVVGFSLDRKARKHLLASCGFTNIMQLAADNQPLTKVRPESLARYFVPELAGRGKNLPKHVTLIEMEASLEYGHGA